MSEIACRENYEKTLTKCVDRMYEYVVATYGPHGQNVLISEGGRSFLTKDGVTVAKSVFGDTENEEAVLKILKQCADKTVQDAGDGTTTSILLVREFVYEFLKMTKIWCDIPKMELYNAYRDRIRSICSSLEFYSEAVDSEEILLSVARIASNNDEQIASLVTDLISKVGLTGTVSITESKDTQTSVKVFEGCRFASKVLANAFLPENKEKRILNDCVVVISTSVIHFSQEILELLTQCSINKKSILFVCPDMEEKLLLTIAANVEKGFQACVISPAYLGAEKLEVMEDIATICGTFPSNTQKISRTTLKEWGYAKTIEITRTLTTIVDAAATPEQMDSVIQTLKTRLAESEDEFIVNRLVARINRLTSTVGVLYIGGQTAADAAERRFRAEDALESCNSAMKKGVVAGGGTFLRYITQPINEKKQSAFDRMINESIHRICKQQSVKLYGNQIIPYKLDKKKLTEVLDLRSQKFELWFDNGIVESVWTVQSALQNAFATAWLLCNTFGAISR